MGGNNCIETDEGLYGFGFDKYRGLENGRNID